MSGAACGRGSRGGERYAAVSGCGRSRVGGCAGMERGGLWADGGAAATAAAAVGVVVGHTAAVSVGVDV